MITTSNNKQSGAVSLFVVIFFMLLVTVVTVSFLRLMVADQQQASDNDLSQSAYDSAQAGVEDAKRALLKYQKDCSTNPAGCGAYAAAVASPECNRALGGISGSGDGSTAEIKVQQSQAGGTDAALNQAYTCVTMKLQTEDYIGTIPANQSQLVPLISTGAFSRVQVEWFSREDVPTAGSSAVSLTGVDANGQPLLQQSAWPVNRPPVMRAQLIQFASNFTVGSFDTFAGTAGGTQANAATMFLYPTSQAGIGERAFTAYDQRKNSPTDNPDAKDKLTTPTPVTCKTNINSGGYACSAVLVLPDAIGASSSTDRTAFLRLLPFYNATHFKVTLWNGPVDPTNPSIAPVKFKDVQPEVDSTGRANDVFRRVVSRVDLFDTSFPYPEATIDVTGNFCKDFAVTDTQYIAGTTSCTP